MLAGPVLFVGDSITVGLSPFVDVTGEKMNVAVGGISTGGPSGMLAIVKSDKTAPLLARAKTMSVLGGTNDIGSNLSADQIVQNLQQIWQTGKLKGVKVIAMTIPPTRGYSGFAANPAGIEQKRLAVNAAILSSTVPDITIDSDAILGDGKTPPALSAKADSGDHLHPRKDVHGAAINTELARQAAIPPATPTLPSPGLISPETHATAAGIRATAKLGAETAAVGGILYGGYRLLKHWRWF